ncbi:hypothetical protein KSB_93790 [Ktedonobacter robiniae]|uniref:Uncharacterized protein n=1 Tax=Ktedonobacter robiniae TaxID=2778365 RepID=A0ABQ3V7C2_9CHLR|nr:hypothetical protein KSB_93790 [Ktedonobacter robiniae]
MMLVTSTTSAVGNTVLKEILARKIPANDTMKFAKMTLEGALFLEYASCEGQR